MLGLRGKGRRERGESVRLRVSGSGCWGLGEGGEGKGCRVDGFRAFGCKEKLGKGLRFTV